MPRTVFHKVFALFKQHLPHNVSSLMRSWGTGVLTPILFSYETGHFLSSLRLAAVSRAGEPLPWYSYPAIDFLARRSYADKAILEFGGGQSTLWWARRAKRVITFEGNPDWYAKIKKIIPDNVDLYHASMESAMTCVRDVELVLNARSQSIFDVVIIDGLYRSEMIPIAQKHVAETGLIICDNAEGYGIYEGFKEANYLRVDFYGFAPGVILPHVTSMFFNPQAFAFNPQNPISMTVEGA